MKESWVMNCAVHLWIDEQGSGVALVINEAGIRNGNGNGGFDLEKRVGRAESSLGCLNVAGCYCSHLVLMYGSLRMKRTQSSTVMTECHGGSFEASQNRLKSQNRDGAGKEVHAGTLQEATLWEA
jgi:hypothetical protein